MWVPGSKYSYLSTHHGIVRCYPTARTYVRSDHRMCISRGISSDVSQRTPNAHVHRGVRRHVWTKLETPNRNANSVVANTPMSGRIPNNGGSRNFGVEGRRLSYVALASFWILLPHLKEWMTLSSWRFINGICRATHHKKGHKEPRKILIGCDV